MAKSNEETRLNTTLGVENGTGLSPERERRELHVTIELLVGQSQIDVRETET